MPSNPQNIPGIWPAEVLENVSSPPDENWQIMTLTEYTDYRSLHWDAYSAWKTEYENLEA